MVAARDDITHVARLHSIVAIMVHQLEGLLHVALVVLRGRRGFMMHQNLHTLRVGIGVEHLDVEVGIGCLEVEHIAFPHVRPVFPTYVPSFHQHLVKSVLGGEVDVTFHLLVVCGMTSVGLCLLIIDDRGLGIGEGIASEFDAGELIGVVPRALADDHLPPHTTVFRGMNPRGVFNFARFVEVEDEVAGKHVAGIVAHHHRAPRGLTRRLHRPLQTRCIGGQMADKSERLGQRIVGRLGIRCVGIASTSKLGRERLCLSIHQLEMHRGIVGTGSLVDVNVETVVALHLKRGLHTCLGENSH